MKQAKVYSKKQIPSVLVSTRIREDIFNIVSEILKKADISIRDIIEYSLIDYILKIDIDLKYNGIDYKEIANAVKMEKLRNTTKIIRNEYLSSQLIIPRIRYDVYKLVSVHKNNKSLAKIISDYLDIMKKECMHYQNSKEVLMYIKEFEDDLYNNEIDRIKSRIENQIEKTEFMENIENKIKIGVEK